VTTTASPLARLPLAPLCQVQLQSCMQNVNLLFTFCT
jgi:hypothetical protein